jgi:hypothetical protein
MRGGQQQFFESSGGAITGVGPGFRHFTGPVQRSGRRFSFRADRSNLEGAEMISVTAAQIEAIIHDDVEALLRKLERIRDLNERMRIVLGLIPEIIAARGPFRDQAHVFDVTMQELNRAFALLGGFVDFDTIGTA